MTAQLPHKVLSVPDERHKRWIQNEAKLRDLSITSGLMFPAALLFLILFFAEH